MATEGEIRVVHNFNPSQNIDVFNIKLIISKVIDDALDYATRHDDPHIKRWCAESATCLETGAMYLVKALTHDSTHGEES